MQPWRKANLKAEEEMAHYSSKSTASRTAMAYSRWLAAKAG